MFHLKPLAFLASLALLAAAAKLSVVRADDAPTTAPAVQTGTIKGTLVDADGKAIAGSAKVSLFAFHPHGHKKSADGGEKPKPIQTVKLTASDNGAYTFTDVPPGKYTIAARAKIDGNKCSGRTGKPEELDAGATVTVDPITLKPGGHSGKHGAGPSTAPAVSN